MNLKMLITGCPRSGTGMLARVLYFSGITVGGEFDGPNAWNEISTYEDCGLRMVVWSLKGRSLLAEMHRKPYRPTQSDIEMLRVAVEAYQYDAFKLPNILGTWDAWKEVIAEDTLMVFMHRNKDAISKSLAKLSKGKDRNDRIALVDWCERKMDSIRAEREHVVGINFRDCLNPEGQEKIQARFLPYFVEHFPNTALDFGGVKP